MSKRGAVSSTRVVCGEMVSSCTLIRMSEEPIFDELPRASDCIDEALLDRGLDFLGPGQKGLRA